ncbi:MAG: hypoxanthine phosphoribosyltransferase [Schwartzia sp.]|nr:hypoxanthine phosphoribosyltransferase [Schwartzia sp. (in: firmicutes)]
MMMDDVERVLFTPEEIEKKVAELGRRITEDYDGEDVVVVGVLKGAAVFTTDLVRKINLPVQLDFIVASSYGNGATTSGTVKIKKDLDTDIKGRNVLICEDIIDTGTTMANLLKMLRTREPKSLRLCAILSKPSRRIDEVKIDYCGWEVPDEFLVGYGLDYSERYRNMPAIGILKRSVYEK